MRVVSLVPSLTEAVAAVGAASTLVGVTDWCTVGAPAGARRVGGTKNPDVAVVVGLRPDLVLANGEENRDVDLAALRQAGVTVETTLPTSVRDVAGMLTRVATLVGGDSAALTADLDRALAQAGELRPRTPVAAVGAASTLVGVTDWCTVGAPADARRVGGTKNPDVAAVVGLRPDLVLANGEENRDVDLAALRQAGVTVETTLPTSVDDVAGMLTRVATLVGGDATALTADLDRALAHAGGLRPRTPVAAVTLIWRRPWRAIGPGTYADDLLTRCGFANVLSGWQDRYPALDPSLRLGPEVALLPSEPYAFGEADRSAVHELLGEVPLRFVDGQLLTWHGPRTAAALRVFATLAAELDAGR